MLDINKTQAAYDKVAIFKSQRMVDIVNMIAKHQPVSTSELGHRFNLSPSDIMPSVNSLLRSGMVTASNVDGTLSLDNYRFNQINNAVNNFTNV